jgi:RNA polymerase sigma-70 factor, ECF subfamily
METPVTEFFSTSKKSADKSRMEIRDLVARASAREAQAWETVVRQYGPLIWRLLQKFRNLEKEALDDLFQDVFTVLLNGGLTSFRGSSEHEFRAYLKVITENEARNCLRKHGRKLEVFEQPTDSTEGGDLLRSFDVFTDPSPGPEEQAIGLEIRTKLGRCIQQIQQIDQEIFWMKERGLAHKEISETLGLPQGTVGSKYHRAKEALADCLEKAGITGVREK